VPCLNLNYLLIFIPIALGLYWSAANPLLVFAMAALTIVPLFEVSRLELVALIVSVFTARNMTIDGKTDWLEGAMLIAVFAMLGIGFYYAS
jgi:Ca2+:H+ antiporter